jgi:hypothetical protein
MNGDDWDRCRSYIRHMDREHRRLGASLGRVRHVLAGPAQPKVSLQRELAALRQELARHFQEEEEGGCLDEAVSRCGTLAHEVRIIEAQHRELLADVDRLIEIAASGAIARLAADFDRFASAVEEHEALEDHVLQHGFNMALDV